jgi:hypothetical protein
VECTCLSRCFTSAIPAAPALGRQGSVRRGGQRQSLQHRRAVTWSGRPMVLHSLFSGVNFPRRPARPCDFNRRAGHSPFARLLSHWVIYWTVLNTSKTLNETGISLNPQTRHFLAPVLTRCSSYTGPTSPNRRHQLDRFGGPNPKTILAKSAGCPSFKGFSGFFLDTHVRALLYRFPRLRYG